ncbi:hypothetical protein BZM26_09945 [Paraburkholderia strydomiana]|nr:hypothetical protein BZM26_09945 [Paraburkholderia strydomiana]
MKQGLWSAALAVSLMTGLLSGCNRIGEQVGAFYSKEAKVDTPTIVVNAGYKAMLTKDGSQGEPVILSGFDKCPEQGRLLVLGTLGSAPNEARNDCIVIDKSRSSVKVQAAYVAAHRVVVEQWAINRIASPAGDRIALVPPGGGTLLDVPTHI